MRIEQLLYLVEVANYRSISVAAQNLFTTQPNISKALKALETELDMTFFTRQKNTLIFTEEGLAVTEYARAILKQVDLLKAYAQTHRRPPEPLQGELKILYPPQIRHMLSEVFSIFHEQHPQVVLSLLVSETTQILENIQQIDADVFFINFNSNDTAAKNLLENFHSDSYELSFLLSERLYLFAAPTQPFADKKEISFKELSDIPLGCVKNEQGQSDFLIGILAEKYGCTFSLSVNDSDLLLQKCLSGYCSAVITPTSISRYHKQFGKIIPIQDNVYKNVHMATSTVPAKRDLIQAFLTILSEQVAECKLSAPL